MTDLSQIERILDAQTTAVESLDRRSLQRLYTGWQSGWVEIESELNVVLSRIEAARAAGVEVTQAWLYQAERLAGLREVVAQQVEALAAQLGVELPRSIADAATLGAAHGADLLATLTAQWDSPNLRAVRALIDTTTAPRSPLARLLRDFAGGSSDVARQVANTLVAGIVVGQNPRRIARLVRQQYAGASLARATTIARTEVLRAYREAQRTSYSERGVDEWVWISARNARTCPACWAKHGTRYPTSERLPAHPNCRCRLLPAVDGLDVDDGEVEFAKLSPDEQRVILGPGRYDAYKNGDASLADMVVERQSAVWGTSVATAPVRSLQS